MQFNLEGSFKVRELELKFKSRTGKMQQVSSPKEVANLLRPMLKNEPREKFVGLFLDIHNHVAALEVISVGTSNSAQVSPRECFKMAFLTNSSAMIFAHNHPSGDANPSGEDIEIAKLLKHGAQLLQFEMMDFLIVCPKCYYSFAESQEWFSGPVALMQ